MARSWFWVSFTLALAYPLMGRRVRVSQEAHFEAEDDASYEIPEESAVSSINESTGAAPEATSEGASLLEFLGAGGASTEPEDVEVLHCDDAVNRPAEEQDRQALDPSTDLALRTQIPLGLGGGCGRIVPAGTDMRGLVKEADGCFKCKPNAEVLVGVAVEEAAAEDDPNASSTGLVTNTAAAAARGPGPGLGGALDDVACGIGVVGTGTACAVGGMATVGVACIAAGAALILACKESPWMLCALFSGGMIQVALKLTHKDPPDERAAALTEFCMPDWGDLGKTKAGKAILRATTNTTAGNETSSTLSIPGQGLELRDWMLNIANVNASKIDAVMAAATKADIDSVDDLVLLDHDDFRQVFGAGQGARINQAVAGHPAPPATARDSTTAAS